METVKQFAGKVGAHIRLNKKRYLAAVLAMAVAVGGGGFMMKKKRLDAVSSSAYSPSFIRTTKLTKTTLSDSISATGIIESNNVSNVTTTLKAAVKSVSVAVGDYVEEGDVICTLDTADIEKQISRAEEKWKDSIESAQERYDDALEKYNDARDTYDDYYDDYDDARDAYRDIRKEYQAAVAELEYYNDALSEAESALKKAAAAVVDADTYAKKLEKAEEELDDANAALAAASPDDENYSSLEQAAEDAETAYDKAKEKAEANDLSDANDAYDRAKSACEDAEYDLNLKKSALGFTSLEKDYNTKLSAYESAYEKYEKYESTLEDLKDALEDAKEALEDSKENDDLEDFYDSLEDYTLKAETAGYVTSLNATVGSNLSDTNVATIQDTEDLIISISIAEYDIDSVELGMRAIITSDSIDGSVEGKLTQIAPVASGGYSSSASFAAEVSVLGGSNGLIIGVNAKVELILSTAENVFTVPIDAVGTNEDGETIVYVKTGGSGVDALFEEAVVTTGESNDYYIEISGDSLEEGMEVRSSADLTEATYNVSTEDATSGDSAFPSEGMSAGTMAPGGNMGGNMGGGMPSGGNMGGMGGRP